MPDAWLNPTRTSSAAPEKLLALPEQEFAGWALHRCAVANLGTGLAVTIHGEPGSGKSALVRNMLRQLSPERRRKVLLFSATQWTNHADDLPGDEFAMDPQKPSLVICEDLATLPEPKSEGDRLAAWIDRWRANGVSFIATTDRLPSEIPDLSRRLINRLQGGLLAGIRPLSGASQQQLWQSWSTELTLPAFSPDRVPAAVATVGQLRTWATSWHSQPERNQTPLRSDELDVSLETIAQLVAVECGIPLDLLLAGGRSQQLRIPRGIAMLLARELTPLALTTISRYFGCRSHTTVVRSCARVEQLMPNDPPLRQQLQSLRTRLCQTLSADCG